MAETLTRLLHQSRTLTFTSLQDGSRYNSREVGRSASQWKLRKRVRQQVITAGIEVDSAHFELKYLSPILFKLKKLLLEWQQKTVVCKDGCEVVGRISEPCMQSGTPRMAVIISLLGQLRTT